MFPVGQQHIIDPRVDGGDLGAEVTPAAFNLGMHDPPHPEEHADPGSARLRFYGRPVLVTTISVSLLLTTSVRVVVQESPLLSVTMIGVPGN